MRKLISLARNGARTLAVPAPETPKRILIASHGHPAITRGGAEIAAYSLYRKLRSETGVEAWFLGCQPGGGGDRLGTAISQPYDEHEFVYSAGEFDWLKFANRDPNFPSAFRALLREIRPDVVHFHHFINFGVEAIGIVRELLPHAQIVMTLHEYLAICHHFGQMVKTERFNLCNKATLEDCHRCFPSISPAEFHIRNLYINRFFQYIHTFISPSHFLAERFACWGVPSNRIQVIENVIERPDVPLRGEMVSAKDSPLRVGFFGQISKLKGIAVLLDAAANLAAAQEVGIVFEIFGDYRGQPLPFQEEFLKQLAATGSNVRYHGRYDPNQVDALMQSIDVTIVPSIWWENSPVVIQEAFRNKRPVICSNIGGLAEKVRKGLDGWHFPVGSSLSLVALLRRLADDRASVSNMSLTVAAVPSPDEVVQSHFECYGLQKPSADLHRV